MTRRILTGLAAVLLLAALVVPDDATRLNALGFLVIPIEALLGVVIVVLLPARARTAAAIVAGVAIGLVTILKLIDLGFGLALARKFDPLADWPLFRAAEEWLAESFGQTGATAAVIGVVVLALALPVGLAWAVLRLSRVVVPRRTVALRAAVSLGLVWVVLAVAGLPAAGWSTAGAAWGHAVQLREDVSDQASYERDAAVDAYRDTPTDKLLAGLRGKDVVLAFVESYGRDAVGYPSTASLLASGTKGLEAAGYQSRSGWLTSSTIGGGSWYAHSTLQSGLWVDSQRRYGTFIESDRFTLAAAFKRAGWRTAAVMPANSRDWPEGRVYGYDQIYDSRNLGYEGPRFSFSSIPDQYTISAFQRLERARPDHQPVMAQLDLLSSHAPWAPVPQLTDWATLGDGSGYPPTDGSGGSPDTSGKDAGRVKDDYRTSIEYSVGSIVSYVETYGDDNLVVVMLGDHQPSPVITGSNPNRDVPITVIAKDPAVMRRIEGWGWSPGLAPAPAGPVWRMDAFRDRFFAAFGG